MATPKLRIVRYRRYNAGSAASPAPGLLQHRNYIFASYSSGEFVALIQRRSKIHISFARTVFNPRIICRIGNALSGAAH